MTAGRGWDKDKFHVNGIGVQEWMRPGIVDRPNGTGDWLLMFFYHPVNLMINGNICDCVSHRLMIWSPESGHYYGNTDCKWNHSWIHCQGKRVEEILKESHIETGVPLSVSASVMENFLISAYSEITSQRHPDPVILVNMFHIWIRELRRAVYENDLQKIIPERMMEVKNYMDTHFNERLSLNGLAKISCMSVSHFCSEFKSIFETAPIEYLIRLRMRNAGYLLRDRNMTVAEIASRVGYEDVFHFSKLFKKHVGKSPVDVRGEFFSL